MLIFHLTEINECSAKPCQNGGSCIDAIAGYSCSCVAGYTGHNCQTGERYSVSASTVYYYDMRHVFAGYTYVYFRKYKI